VPAQLGAFRLEAQEWKERIRELEEQIRKSGGGIEIPLTKLHEVKGRRRHMPRAKYEELRSNLQRNKLIHPVRVMLRVDGEYDIVSGHHRVDAYRELGRETIRCVLDEMSLDEAESQAFYANLHQSDLTDYEKYLGFAKRQREAPGITQAQLAEESGLSTSAVSYLFSFADLPSKVLELLADNPGMIGVNAAHELAALTRAGNAEQVIAAATQLAAGSIDQQKALQLARVARESNTRPKLEADTFKVKAGRATYCDVRRAKNVMRLQFKSEQEAEEVSRLIRELLEQRANGQQKPETEN